MKLAGNMKILPNLFNIILLGACLGLAAGCKTGLKSKLKAEDATTLSCFIEAHPGLGDRTMPVRVGRNNPVSLTVEASPYIREINVLKAEAWDTTDGGVAIRLELDRFGSRKLEIASVMHRGRRMAVMVQFPESRWIDIVELNRKQSDGVLILYPDASPEEVDRIVKGLNLLAEAIKEDRDEEEQ
jgi:hypothetical protein